MKSVRYWYIRVLYVFLDISKGPPVQFPGQLYLPTSFGAPPGKPSAPEAPSHTSSNFSNAPPISFGMPQPYSQATDSIQSVPPPMQSNMPYPTQQTPYPPPYPPQQMPYPQQQMSYPQQQMPYPQQQTPYPPQSASLSYPQQQNYNVYPNLQKAPEAREYFGNMASSFYPCGSNATNSSSYQSGSYHGGQGVSSSYPYAVNPPIAASRAPPAPRTNQVLLKVRLRLMN